MDEAVFPPCCLTWDQTMVEVVKIMVTSSKGPVHHCCSQCPRLCSRPLLTHASVRDSWTLTGMSGSASPGATAPFSWVLVHTRFCLCPPGVCFPVLCRLSNQIPLTSKVKISCGSQSLFQIPQVGKCVGSPRTFLTVWEFLWYNFSAVCGLSAWWLYGRIHSNLLQEHLCHRLCNSGRFTQSLCPCSRPLVTCISSGDTNICLAQSLCSCWVLVQHYGLYSPWKSPSQNPGLGSLSLLQGIFPTGIEPRCLTLQVDSLPAESQGKPKNTGVGNLFLLQWIFLTQELKQGLPHCRQILYQLSFQGSSWPT